MGETGKKVVVLGLNMLQYSHKGGGDMHARRGRLRNTVLSTVFAVLFAAAAALYAFSEPLYERQRAAAIEQVLGIFADGTFAVDVDASAYPVHGEEDAGVAVDAAAFGAGTAPGPVAEGRVALYLYGVLSVPALSLRLPLYDGMDAAALRFGAGVAVSEGGVTVICGLRTGVSGRLLHDIDLLSEGDGASITHTDGTRTVYTVSAVKLLSPNELKKELQAPPDGCTTVIVSNHPAGETSGRIVVWLKKV